MRIVILSGGTGNDALVKGLVKYGNKDNEIFVITNAYDNGKSTGICRSVTDTLGVSDIRKNHYRMYECLNEGNVNEDIKHFYCDRFNFTKGHEFEEVKQYLTDWHLTEYIEYARHFFSREKASEYEYKDFSVANIIYSEFYSEYGYYYTNNYFCGKLRIPDFVYLNSYDNVYIKAKTESGKIISDEGDIVEYKNPGDKITDIVYSGEVKFSLNEQALECMKYADVVIISTGTFYSSLYPTLFYGDFYKKVNDLFKDTKVIWVMNTAEDKDTYGVTSNDFIDKMEKNGLDLKRVTILENTDAVESLRMPNDKYNIVYSSMGNNKGKNDPEKYFYALKEIVDVL